MIRLLLALLCLLPLNALAQGDVAITELMARNGVYQNGEAHDWLEVTNTNGQAVSLAGWGLSDDAQAPFAFVFPEGTRLAPGEAVLVWCVGDAGPEVKGALNAPFKLSGDGETLYLTDPDGTIVQALPFPPQFGNTAWGVPGGGQACGFFEEATPGKPNGDELFQQRVEPTEGLQERFFQGELLVTLTSASCSELR